MVRFRLLVPVTALFLLLCGCDNRKQKPDPSKGRVTGTAVCADTGKPARFAYVTLVPMPAPNSKLDADDSLAAVGSTHTASTAASHSKPSLPAPTSSWPHSTDTKILSAASTSPASPQKPTTPIAPTMP